MTGQHASSLRRDRHLKLFSAAIGLEEGYITPQTTVYDRVVFDKVYPPAACWSKTSHGYVNVSQGPCRIVQLLFL